MTGLLVFAMALACATAAPSEPSVNLPPTLQSGITGKLKGDDQVRYNGASLFEYIDGGADVYIDAGFEACFVRRYRARSEMTPSVEVSVYAMRSPMHAFGLFRTMHDSSRSGAKTAFELTTGPRGVSFLKDKYYVKVMDVSPSGLAAGSLDSLVGPVSASLSGTTSAPVELALLPAENMVVRSERFRPKDFLSRSFLRNGLSAEYETDSTKLTFFILLDIPVDSTMTAIGTAFPAIALDETPGTLSGRNHVVSERILAVVAGQRIAGVWGRGELTKKMQLLEECLSLIDR